MSVKAKVKILSSDYGYDLAAKGYDKKQEYLNSFEKGRILPLLGDLSNKKVLDVGAGTGRLSLLLAAAGAKVAALDISSEMLKVLKQKNSCIETIVGDAENLMMVDNVFDFVIAAFLIVHLKDPARFFDEVYRVLKPGGKFLVTNINQKEPPLIETKNGMIKIESFYHRPEEVREKLEDLAFTILREEMIKEKDVWVNQIILAEK